MNSKNPKNRKRSRKTVQSAHKADSKLRHLKLVHHRHNFRLLPLRHTSHALTAFLLVVVGLLVYIFATIQDSVSASTQSVSHGLNVTAIIPGPAPTMGATITTPSDGTLFTDQPIIEVDGTCEPNSFVVVADNSSTVGSANCTSGGIFTLTAQIDEGQNVLSAKNYDTLNQAGPDTPNVTVTLKITPTSPIGSNGGSVQQPPTTVTQPAKPLIAENPSTIEGVTKDDAACDQQKTTTLPVGGKPRVFIDCIPRIIDANVEYSMRIVVYGGTSPYAVNIDWGDGSPMTLISIASASYKTVKFKYTKAGEYTIKINVKDSEGLGAFVQTATTVKGEAQTVLGVIGNSLSHASFFETPVPLYVTASVSLLGFWVGDWFSRHFGVDRIVKHLRRHRV